MSYSELNEYEKRGEVVTRNIRTTGASSVPGSSGGVNTLVTKMQAQKLALEPKWSNKKSDNLTELISTDQEDFLTKGLFFLLKYSNEY